MRRAAMPMLPRRDLKSRAIQVIVISGPRTLQPVC